MKIINPYKDIDWANASRVKAISHEHIFTKQQLKIAYDRGIRYFACVNYSPSAPSYPLKSWNYTFKDFASPTDLTLVDLTTSGAIETIVDANGNDIDTDNLVQLPNAEHAYYEGTNFHFNILGSLYAESGNGNRRTGEWSEDSLGMSVASWYSNNRKWSLLDIEWQYLTPQTQLFNGKVFGTINHPYNLAGIKQLLNMYPSLFRAIEIVNQGETDATNEGYRNYWDELLAEGKRIWGVSAIDWQVNAPDGLPKIGACNVLLINNYSGTNIQKSEMGLDAYIGGNFLPSGLGDKTIVNISADEDSGVINIALNDTPDKIIIVTNQEKMLVNSSNEAKYSIKKGDKFVRFEAWWYDDNGRISDYVLTNPIFIEENEMDDNKIIRQCIALNII